MSRKNAYICMKEPMLQKLAGIYNVSKGTLSVHDIDSASEMMQLLFALEDYGVVRLNEVYGEFVLRLDASCMPEPETSLQVLQKWSEKGKQLASGKISKEEYDHWRYCSCERQMNKKIHATLVSRKREKQSA